MRCHGVCLLGTQLDTIRPPFLISQYMYPLPLIVMILTLKFIVMINFNVKIITIYVSTTFNCNDFNIKIYHNNKLTCKTIYKKNITIVYI